MAARFSSEEDVDQVARGLLDRSLPKAQWTHAAHFAATLWLLRHRPDLELEATLPGIIRAYNEAVGGENTDTAGYHHTITLASIAAARAFLANQGAGRPLHEVVGLLMASPLGRPDWLMAYWSRERLFSVEARRGWVAADLRPVET